MRWFVFPLYKLTSQNVRLVERQHMPLLCTFRTHYIINANLIMPSSPKAAYSERRISRCERRNSVEVMA